MPRQYRDAEIDAVSLRYQIQWCAHESDMKATGLARLVQKALADEHPRFLRISCASMASLMSGWGCTSLYMHEALLRVEEWVRTGFTKAVFKAMHATWAHSFVEQPDGTYRAGTTDEVNAALVRAVEALGFKTCSAEMFYWRCRFGWGTCAEIRNAGYMRSARKGGVLPKEPALPSEPMLFDDDDEDETLEDRVDRLEAELEELRVMVGGGVKAGDAAA